MSTRHGLAGALALFLHGCAVGPDYRRPDTAATGAFRDQPDDRASLADLPWWELFSDEALEALIAKALEKSPTAMAAAARVEQARALAQGDGWALWPSIGANAAVGRQRALVNGAPATFTLASASANVSWELDLWGRLRRTQEASFQTWVASQQAQRGTAVMLVADVAQTYFLLRAVDAQKQIALQRLTSRSRALELFSVRLQHGTGNRAEVAAAKAQVMDATAQLAELERRQRLTENQLQALVGSPPGEVARGSSASAQVVPPQIPVGLPSALLERRPDLLAAEAQLHAETARVGAAQANLFPRISLTSALGLASPGLAEIFAGREAQWSYGGALAWLAPILGREQLLAAVEAQKGRTAEVTALYLQAVLNALREVDDSLASLAFGGRQVEALEGQVAAVMEQLRLAESRYQSGVASYLEVTTAEEAALPAQLALENARAARLVALVSLYRALGGGWQSPKRGEAQP